MPKVLRVKQRSHRYIYNYCALRRKCLDEGYQKIPMKKNLDRSPRKGKRGLWRKD